MSESQMTFSRKLLLVALTAALLGLFGFGIPFLAWCEGVSVEAALQLSETIISWPVVVLVIALVFLTRFRSGLEQFLENIGSITLPGVVEIQRQAAIPIENEDIVDNQSVVLTAEQQEELRKMFAELEESRELTETQHSEIKKRFEQATMAAITWRFRYLASYLVPNTKRVLHWFSLQTANSPLKKWVYGATQTG